jgi:RNA polymerase sigma-B factor
MDGSRPAASRRKELAMTHELKEPTRRFGRNETDRPQRYATSQRNRGSAALFRRYRATRDDALRDHIVTRHLPLARSIARSFDTSRVPFDDLLQVASIGLIKAVDRYDPAHGATFATYAVPTIRGEVLRYFRDHTWGVRPPRDLQERALELLKASDEMRAEAGRAPSPAELAERVGTSVEDVLDALYASQARDGSPIERPVDDHDEAVPQHASFGVEDSGYDQVDNAVTAQLLMTDLTALERRVVQLRFHHDLTQAEAGQSIGCSQMQVSRIQRRAIDKLTRTARPESVAS